MHLHSCTYSLKLRHVFSIAGNSRNETPVVFVRITSGEHQGYGEASLPPYLGENQQTVIQFLARVDLSNFDDPLQTELIMDYVNALAPANLAAKACIDIALHDLAGKVKGKPLWDVFGAIPSKMPDTSCTLGIDNLKVTRGKLAETAAYKIVKVKLGGTQDKAIVELIRKNTFKTLCADANQGWKDKHEALEMIWFLKDQGFKFIEQPLPRENIKDMIWLSENSPLPLVADESCQTLNDIEPLHGVFRGINIKLMKCGGLIEALKMIHRAREFDMKVLIGCMNESSCAIMAGASLAPFCDWADLDGPFLINNNPFEDPQLVNGKIVLTQRPGLGLVLREEDTLKLTFR